MNRTETNKNFIHLLRIERSKNACTCTSSYFQVFKNHFKNNLCNSLNGFMNGSPNETQISWSYSRSCTLVISFPYWSNTFLTTGAIFGLCGLAVTWFVERSSNNCNDVFYFRSLSSITHPSNISTFTKITSNVWLNCSASN